MTSLFINVYSNDWIYWTCLNDAVLCAVELSGAGDGAVEILISGPNGELVPHQTVPVYDSLLEVHFTPEYIGIHTISVTYNGVPASGRVFVAHLLITWLCQFKSGCVFCIPHFVAFNELVTDTEHESCWWLFLHPNVIDISAWSVSESGKAKTKTVCPFYYVLPKSIRISLSSILFADLHTKNMKMFCSLQTWFCSCWLHNIF